MVIFAASSIPGRALPPTLLFPGQDKLEHGLVYAVLGFCVARALGVTRGRWALLGVAALITLAYGASDELHQSFVPGRAVEWLDLCADGVGGLCGGFVRAIATRPRPLVT